MAIVSIPLRNGAIVPRPNPPRSIATEQTLARRIAYEREKRGMSYEGLALRMTKTGCPINASALYKIEKADPPRRITVNELVALARVFEVPVNELLVPPEVAADKQALQLAQGYEAALAAEEEAFLRLADHIRQHPRVGAVLEEHLSSEAVGRFGSDAFTKWRKNWRSLSNEEQTRLTAAFYDQFEQEVAAIKRRDKAEVEVSRIEGSDGEH
jgi:transcriptional regulator with XRE-family HTH domain